RQAGPRTGTPAGRTANPLPGLRDEPPRARIVPEPAAVPALPLKPAARWATACGALPGTAGRTGPGAKCGPTTWGCKGSDTAAGGPGPRKNPPVPPGLGGRGPRGRRPQALRGTCLTAFSAPARSGIAGDFSPA